ncbi:hypothetical protein BJ085DRAFT_32162 [Dimargaris cristalligena]|uniref:Condensation domain-containing protein n=1 Tax=Dimargaris cristalligena TaxID=215637 RepID=A0A4P9ZP79_9FUNG|nr:hypothetical protein BJ085DRAFT_32162 [Dimargaris cristalligena]|eukprot:RKP35143.1 hypothetical protein BJ085DRAFT_32162 [Dimargaris cristalligena]
MKAISPTIGHNSLHQPIQYQTPFPLTPVQLWFFDHPWRNPNHFNQSFALELTRPLSALQIESALLRLVNHHDILRCQFTKNESNSPSQWTQSILPPFTSLPIPLVEAIVPLSDCPSQFISIQSSMDISQGHHLAAGLVTVIDCNANIPNDSGSYPMVPSQSSPRQLLFLTIHHLAVDLVSWSILLEDLARIIDGQQPIEQHTSFATWATELVDWAKESSTVAKQSSAPIPSFLLLTGSDTWAYNTQGNSESLSITLDKIHSDIILGVDARLIQPLELMFAGLFRALYSLTQASTITIFNESHGRHSWDTSLDPSQTVGWFTALVPCQVQADASTSSTDFLKLAKQALRSSNGTNGLQYGLQRIVNHSEAVASKNRPYLPMEVVFNYLGHTVDHSTLTQHGRAPWSPRPELTSDVVVCDADELRTQLVEIIGYPTPEGIRFMVHFCPQVIATGIVESLLGFFRDSLIGMVQDTKQSSRISLWTPSDFPDLQATLPDLAKLESELGTIGLTPYDVEDLYPMLPMQQGMWTATAKDPSEYLVQLAFTVTGVSTVDQLETATRAVISRHAILRTVFLTSWSNPHCQGVQVNLAQGFKPNEPLLRIYVKQLAPNSFRYLLTIHHTLVDGWSFGILLDQLRAHLQRNPEQITSPTTSFHDYVSFIHNSDNTGAESFWQEYLRGVEHPTELYLPKPPSTPDSRKADFLFTLFPDAGHISKVARQTGITPYTLIKAAWSLLLSRYTDHTEVVFGNTVSGRALPLPDIESHLGCFINTVPFRVPLKPEMSVIELVTMIHQSSHKMVPFEHLHLSKINEWVNAEVRPSDMFNTLLVYENYPDTGLDSLVHSVTFTDTNFLESTDYPLAVIVQVEGGQLTANLNWSLVAPPHHTLFWPGLRLD